MGLIADSSPQLILITIRLARQGRVSGQIGTHTQNKTGVQVRIEIIGELATSLERIRRRKQSLQVVAMCLLVDENGQPLSYCTLRFRFDRTRKVAGVDKANFQFRDLRAKAGTDTEVGSPIRA